MNAPLQDGEQVENVDVLKLGLHDLRDMKRWGAEAPLKAIIDCRITAPSLKTGGFERSAMQA